MRGDLLISWSFSFQTREQLQADLLRCQAKIEDLEKLLVEKGQVSRIWACALGFLAFLSPGRCPWGLGAEGHSPRICAICPGGIRGQAWQAPGESIPAKEPLCGEVKAQNGLGDSDSALPSFAKCTKPGSNSKSKG